MFKFIAGFILFYMAAICAQNGNMQSADVALFLGVFSIAAGMDTMFFNKK